MSSVTADSTAWWAESVAVVAARVRTDVEHGLTDGEAVLRLERDGANEIVERPPPAAGRCARLRRHRGPEGHRRDPCDRRPERAARLHPGAQSRKSDPCAARSRGA